MQGEPLGSSRFILNVSCELTASGVDIVTSGLSNRGHNPLPHEIVLKGLHILGVRFSKIAVGKRIKGNQIEFTGDSLNELLQSLGVFDSVVDATQQNIFKSDVVTRSVSQVALAGGHQIGKRVLAVNRHDLIAKLIGGRVQRHSQCHGNSRSKFIHLKRKSAGGNRDTPSA